MMLGLGKLPIPPTMPDRHLPTERHQQKVISARRAVLQNHLPFETASILKPVK
jgi:hypothetical protein